MESEHGKGVCRCMFGVLSLSSRWSIVLWLCNLSHTSFFLDSQSDIPRMKRRWDFKTRLVILSGLVGWESISIGLGDAAWFADGFHGE
jgi:hypothetical protein